MEASMGSRPSYAWRSIMYGRQLLEKGLRRTIGSGKETYVWLDKWLFRDTPLAPLRKPNLFNVDLKWVHTHWGDTVKSGYWLASRLDCSDIRREEFSVWDTVAKVIEDSTFWFEAQECKDEEIETENREFQHRNRWEAPTAGSFKCNVGLQWSKQKKILGASWVLRNCDGEAILHSRRAFGNVGSYLDAKFLSLMWATESMRSHHVEKVVFEVEFGDLFGAVTKPKAWSAFRYQGNELRKVLAGFKEWDFMVVTSRVNRCAHAIAKSVTTEKRYLSYVARGNPQWLNDLFEADKLGLGRGQ
ncbi:hypothetical protein Bca52824_022893 [Brassica carinata]|uniref:RNase H type-1 domain-containing protein n=1 Tax=Brassica carinata TaxID=52824 RepID=A0A8X7VHF3_BRACI|nr:hypothetical protein Bca52824_022893 [Brassica carinata]